MDVLTLCIAPSRGFLLGPMSALRGSGRNCRRTRTVCAEYDTVDVVKFRDERALVAAIMAQESMARVVLNTTSALSSSRPLGFAA